MKKKNQKGFTLIELIVVIAILGILAVMIILRLGDFQEGARESSDEQAIAVIRNSALMYMASNDDAVPTMANLLSEDLIPSDTPAVKSKLWGADDGGILTGITIDTATAAIPAVTTAVATVPLQPAVAIGQVYIDVNGRVGDIIE